MFKVSVIIPVYNCSRFLSDAIHSIIEQTYENLEIIVIDDGSSDNTKHVAEKYQNSIRYYFQANSGVSKARNKGIHLSTGKYVAFLDADDLWETHYIEKMVSKIREGFDWVACDNERHFLDSDNNLVESSVIVRQIDEDWSQNELLKEFLGWDRIGSPNKILVRKDALLQNGILFDQNLHSREDWDFCLQLIEKGCRLGILHEPLVIYRVWDAKFNSTRKLGSKWLDYTGILLNKHKEYYQKVKIDSVLSGHYYELARHYLYGKRYLRMVKFIFMSFGAGGGLFLIKTILNKFQVNQ